MEKVYAITVDGDWFIVPLELRDGFLYDIHAIDDDLFERKYGQYRTGGDLNIVQLYADLQEIINSFYNKKKQVCQTTKQSEV